MRYVALLLTCLLAWPAAAQYTGNIPPGTVLGNNQATARPPAPIPYISGPDTSGFVSGPTTSVVNELASWNNTAGNLLKQGSAFLTDNKTGAYTADAAGITVLSKSGISAMDVAVIACGGCAYTDYDALRGVAVANTGSNVVNTAGVAGYVRNQQATSGAGRNAVGLFGMALGEVDNSATWGINTVVMDSATHAAGTHTGRTIVGYESDFNVMSPNTGVTGMLLIGKSLAQPTSANGYACNPLSDPNGTIPNPMTWTSCFISADGAANPFAVVVGAAARSGVDVGSQKIRFNYINEAGTKQGLSLFVSGGEPRTLTMESTEGLGQIGLGLTGDLFMVNPNGAIFMGAAPPKLMASINPANELSIAPGAFSKVIFGSMVSPTPTYLIGLAPIGAGTGKHFVCMDQATAQLYRGSGASCN